MKQRTVAIDPAEEKSGLGAIVAIINRKGGVGKTTTTVNLAAALGRLGRKLLVIDFDPQANATTWIGVDDDRPTMTIDSVLTDPTTMGLVIGPSSCENVQLAYGNQELAQAQRRLLETSYSPAIALRKALKTIDYDQYDYILIDCSPGGGILQINAIAVADEIILPINSQTMALSGLIELKQAIEQLHSDKVIDEIPYRRQLLTMYESRLSLSRDIEKELRTEDGSFVFQASIRRSVQIAESYGYGQSIDQYAPRSEVARDYAKLALEFLEVQDGVQAW